MDQMADEMTLRADVKDKWRVNTAEESSSCLRGERIQSEAQVGNGRPSAAAEKEPADSSRETDAQQPTECDSFTAPLFSLETYLRRSSSAASSSTDSLSSSQQSNMGVDCAEMVLNCLFCRFYDVIRMLPSSCERVAHHCCPNYKQTPTTASTPSTDDDACIDLDCGLLSSCQDASDCLELAMEVSEICYN